MSNLTEISISSEFRVKAEGSGSLQTQTNFSKFEPSKYRNFKFRNRQQGLFLYACVCVFSSHPFWTSSSLDVPAGVTQEEGHTGFLIHLPSAVRALIFVARRIQPFLSLVDREVEFCVLTN